MQPPQKGIQNTALPDLGQDLSRVKAKAPLRFWEIDECFKCPVSGMCMTLAEQKQLLKKTKISVKNASPFEIHEAVVASSDNENRVSRRVDHLLHRKFGKEAAELLKLEHKAFMANFKSADAAGNHAAALWATAIHPDLPMSLKREVFGQIHMSMHFSGEERMKMNRKLASRENELEDSRRCNKKLAQQKRALEKEIQSMKQSQSNLRNALEVAEKELAQIRNMPFHGGTQGETIGHNQEHLFLKAEMEGLYECNQRQQRQIAALKEKNRRLAHQLGCQGELNRRIRHETRTIIAELIAKTRCDQSCPSFDLCQKRILIVGGMSRMETLYRELIEASGGIFEYHDGYMKKGSRQLESRLRRADVVLCPVNCNSHNACSAVKRLAKKHQKPVQMLANSSLQAISEAIWGPGNSQRMIN
jgi:hypothetical protein